MLMYSLLPYIASRLFYSDTPVASFLPCLSSSVRTFTSMKSASPNSVYDFTVKDHLHNDVSLDAYRGKVLLIVNVASKCGLTHSNYKELNTLYDRYKKEGLDILAFPCNQFLGQEPGTSDEIQQTACTMFKAEFPVFDKIEVNGRNEAPVYKFLKSQKGFFLFNSVKWNFTKFLVDKHGKVVDRFSPQVSPLSIESKIKELLNSK